MGSASTQEATWGKSIRVAHGRDGVSFSAQGAGGRRVEHCLTPAQKDPERWQRLQQRLSLVSSMKHPCVLRPATVALEGSVPRVLATVPPNTVLDLMAAGPIDLSRAAAIVGEVAGAVAEAHRLGVVHGCLCPGHVYIEDGRPVVDFMGLDTGPLDDLAGLDVACRPSDTWESPASDVYAMAALLSVMMGKPGDTVCAVSEESGGPVSALMTQMLSSAPAKRPPAAEVAAVMGGYSRGGSEWRAMLATQTGSGVAKQAVTGAELRAGDHVGRYVLRELLGEGGMGRVFRAEDTASGDVVAVKLLHSWVRDERARARFLREAKVLSDIRSPHVARFWEAQPTGDPPFIAMEFLPGDNLDASVIESGRFSEERALEVAADIAGALADIHAIGIVHRDIKPSNVILVPTKEGHTRAKLCDFGIARRVQLTQTDKITRTGSFVGTPQYMSPEQATGEEVDGRSDVYSLGATLYAMLTGQAPCNSAREVVAATSGEELDWGALDELASARVAGLVKRAMAPDKRNRFADAREFLDEVERVRRGEPVQISGRPRPPDADLLLTYELSLDLASSPEELWPFVSNTDRVNEAIGLGAVDISRRVVDGEVQTFGRTKAVGGLTVEWREHPYEWVAPQRLGVVRRFRKGPLRWYRSTVSLQPRGTGTRLTQIIEVAPLGVVGKLAAKFEVGIRTRRALKRVYRRIDAMIQAAPNREVVEDVFAPAEAMDAQSSDALYRRAEELSHAGFPEEVVYALRAYLEGAANQDLARIRPREWADRFGFDESVVLKLFLRSVQVGLLVMRWDIICPQCRIPSSMVDALEDVRDHSDCEACDVSFEVNFARSIELVFQAHPGVRTPDAGTYCIGGPAHRPHVVAQVGLEPGERFTADLSLDPGRYRVVTEGQTSEWVFRVHERATLPRLEVALAAGVSEHRPRDIALEHQQLVLTNDFDRQTVVRVEREGEDKVALTAAEACCVPEFRNLFPSEVLAPGVMVGISHATFLLAQIVREQAVDETELVRRVASLHRAAEREAAAHGGFVLKMDGDGLLCVFSDAGGALRAAWGLAGKEAAYLRQAVHGGPARVTTINRRLDYFGDVLSRLREVADNTPAGAIGVSDELSADPQVVKLVEERAREVSAQRPTSNVWTLNPRES